MLENERIAVVTATVETVAKCRCTFTGSAIGHGESHYHVVDNLPNQTYKVASADAITLASLDAHSQISKQHSTFNEGLKGVSWPCGKTSTHLEFTDGIPNISPRISQSTFF